MAMVTFKKIRGKGFDEMKRDIKMQFITVVDGTIKLGEDTKTHMRTVIQTSKTRGGGSNRLENAIKVHIKKTTNRIVVGVGHIPFLNQYAPYWFFINYGVSQKGMVIPGRGKKVVGAFDDVGAPLSRYSGTGLGKGRFQKGAGSFVLQAKNPINPMMYIERTVAFINTIVRVHYANWTRKTKAV